MLGTKPVGAHRQISAYRRWLLIPLALFGLVSIVGTGGGGGGGDSGTTPPAPPIGDVAGVWTITETSKTSNNALCQPPSSPLEVFNLTVAQNGNSLTVTDAQANVFNGTISGNTVSWTGSYPDGSGTSTISSLSATIDASCNTLSNGTANWSYTEPGFSCSGTTTFIGTRSPASGCGGGTPPPTGASDPLYPQQWHLKNTIQVGQDANVEPAWTSTCGADTCRGNGVRIAVVDDGLEIAHEDLAANVVAGQSWNYVTLTTNPTHAFASSAHGTSVGGVAGARDSNALGGAGVAPRAGLVGYNLLENFTGTNEADSMTRNGANVAVSSNSWGAPDGTGEHVASSATWRTAINTGLSTGRGGRGTIYVWAAGNGHPDDNSNQDGQANNRGVIAVAALTDSGVQASYSERGANLWVSAPSGNFCSNSRTTVTTDRTGAAGYNNNGTSTISPSYPELPDGNYTKCFNGTSSATPVVSGAVALILQANPNLGWRDVRLILAETARQNDSGNSADGIGWQTGAATPAGGAKPNYLFHHNYGFGVINAGAAVARAKTWTNVGAELAPCTVARSGVNVPIADSPGGTTLGPIAQDTAAVAGCGINRIEFVEVTFTSNHTYAGDLQIDLISPAGKRSRLAERMNGCTGACTPYSSWVFGSGVHIGEAANGAWRLEVRDGFPADTGNISSWTLTIRGRAN